MLRVIIFSWLFLLFSSSQASQQSTMYQVDMIVFTHQAPQSSSNIATPLLPPNTQQAIPLQYTGNAALTPYHTLPSSSSELSSEYWTLNRKTNYQVLAHYTWLQPANNQRAVALSTGNRNGWSVEGTLRIRRSNYYLLDTDLLFSKPGNDQTAFLFSQKQRLKPGTVYYLDHPQAGMLIKVHQIT